jgi:hypothetical protein
MRLTQRKGRATSFAGREDLMFGRFLSAIVKLVLVLLLSSLPGALLFSLLKPGFEALLGGMLFVLPFAGAGLLLASPFLLLLRLIGHRSWWSRLGLAVCAGAFCGLTLGYMPDSDTSKDVVVLFNPRGAFVGALVGAFFGLWGGAWWCFFFERRAQTNPLLENAPAH